MNLDAASPTGDVGAFTGTVVAFNRTLRTVQVVFDPAVETIPRPPLHRTIGHTVHLTSTEPDTMYGETVTYVGRVVQYNESRGTIRVLFEQMGEDRFGRSPRSTSPRYSPRLLTSSGKVLPVPAAAEIDVEEYPFEASNIAWMSSNGDIARAIGHVVHVQGLEDGQVTMYSGRVIGVNPQYGTVRVRFDDIHDDGHNVAGNVTSPFLSYALSSTQPLIRHNP